MSETEKNNVSKQNSLPLSASARYKHLSQTRRHSWFGSALDIPSGEEYDKLSAIYDIKERDEENREDGPSWWKIQQWTRENESSSENEIRQRKTNAITEASSQNGVDGKIKKSIRFCGLERKEKNPSESSKLKSAEEEEKRNLPKRRSGLSNWLVSGKGDSNENKDVSDRPSRVSFKPQLGPRQSSTSSPDSRAYSRRATVHYSSNGRPSLMNMKRRTLQQPLKANELRALEQLKDVCRDVIAYKLRQKNLSNRVVLDRQRSKERWLSRDMIFIFRQLERTHQCRYSDISKQIGITLRSEEVLRKVFFELSGEIITTELNKNLLNGNEKNNEDTNKNTARPETTSLLTFGSRITEITWGRMCAVLAVAGGLAVDCVQQGHADLVNYLIDYMGDFAREEDVLPWIVDQGGWESLRDLTYDVSSRKVITSPSYFNKLTNIAIAFVFCTVGTVVATLGIASFANMEN